MHDYLKQWFSLPKTLLALLYLPILMLLLVCVVVSQMKGLPISLFTKDPMSVVGLHPFTGIISNIGILLWSFSLAIGSFTYVVLQCCDRENVNRNFILFASIVSGVFLLDDFFMLHENIIPQYLGIHEKLVLLFYGALLIFYVVFYAKKILSNDITLLLIFFIGLMISVLVDVVPDSYFTWHYLFEDGPKFIGIAGWFGYQSMICFREIQSIKQ